MLALDSLTCGYGNVIAAREVSFSVAAGEILTLIGPNGAGKTTTIMSIAGLLAPVAGRILVDSADITATPARERVRHGMALVPEGRRVFAELSVAENLSVGAHNVSARRLRQNRERVLDLFPRLEERLNQLAGSLSGGEQQMLSLGRAIMAGPKLLLVDELSLGLMPRVIDDCYATLEQLRDEGLAIVLVEQNTERALSVADRVVALDSAHITWSGSGREARANPARLSAYF